MSDEKITKYFQVLLHVFDCFPLVTAPRGDFNFNFIKNRAKIVGNRENSEKSLKII